MGMVDRMVRFRGEFAEFPICLRQLNLRDAPRFSAKVEQIARALEVAVSCKISVADRAISEEQAWLGAWINLS